MNTRKLRKSGAVLALWLTSSCLPAQAQGTTDSTRGASATPASYSLKQAIDYAVINNLTVKNAQSDQASSAARVGEVRSVGLPQITGQAQITRNIDIQNQFVPANAFRQFDENGSPIPPDIIARLAFGVNYQSFAALSLNQLLFDGSYFIGLKAAKTYQELSRKAVAQSKIDVTEAVTKAYYSVLVNRERLNLLNTNVNRLDTLFRETRAQFENGFVEKIDADRLEVQFINIKIDQQRTQRLVELSEYLLKFQMGLPVAAPITLADRLDNPNIENLDVGVNQSFNYNQRLDYSTLQTQRELGLLDVKNNRAGYLPRLFLTGTLGFNTGSNKFDVFTIPWYRYSGVGLGLTVPIFDGLQKRYKIQQARLTHEKTEQSIKLLENSIDLQIQQAWVTLQNGVDALKTQRRNLELAQEVARVAKIKYQQGVGSNIEVINAEASYKEAQTNYYSALYDTLVAKVDLDKATGKLLTE